MCSGQETSEAGKQVPWCRNGRRLYDAADRSVADFSIGSGSEEECIARAALALVAVNSFEPMREALKVAQSSLAGALCDYLDHDEARESLTKVCIALFLADGKAEVKKDD
jgi:hypothetical protein